MKVGRGVFIRQTVLALICMLGAFSFAFASTAGFENLDRLTLQEAEALMFRHNRDIRNAQRQIETAGADRMIAGQRPNPILSFDTDSINPSQGIGAGSVRQKNIEKTIRLEQTFERGHKPELRAEQAAHNESASRAEWRNTVRQQKLALRTAYFDLLLAQEKLAILQDMVGIFARSQEVAERRLGLGDISKIEAARIRVDGLRAANDAGQADTDLTRARHALAALLGAEAQASAIKAVDAWPDPGMPAALIELDAAIALRPDVRAAEARLRASEAGLRLALSATTRDVTVGMQYKHFPVNPEFGTGSGSTYGVTVSVPLFIRHEYQGEIRKAEIERSAAVDALEKVRASARSDLDRAWSELTQAGARVARFQGRLLEDARTAAEGVEFAYRQGAVGVADLLDARRTFRATQIDASAARNDYAKALAAWQLGIGDEPYGGADTVSSDSVKDSAL